MERSENEIPSRVHVIRMNDTLGVGRVANVKIIYRDSETMAEREDVYRIPLYLLNMKRLNKAVDAGAIQGYQIDKDPLPETGLDGQ